MKIYWRAKSIPELSAFSAKEASKIWGKCYWKVYRHWQTWVGLLIYILFFIPSVLIFISAMNKFIESRPYPGLFIILALISFGIGVIIYYSIIGEQMRPYLREYLARVDYRQDLLRGVKPRIILKIFYYVFMGLVILLFIVVVALVKYMQHLNTGEISDFSSVTTPLSYAVARDMCTKLKIFALDERCLPGVVVYAPDFLNDLEIYFGELPKEKATRQELDKVLSAYLIGCNPDNEKPVECFYDLRGDGAYQIWARIEEGNKIYISMELAK